MRFKLLLRAAGLLAMFVECIATRSTQADSSPPSTTIPQTGSYTAVHALDEAPPPPPAVRYVSIRRPPPLAACANLDARGPAIDAIEVRRRGVVISTGVAPSSRRPGAPPACPPTRRPPTWPARPTASAWRSGATNMARVEPGATTWRCARATKSSSPCSTGVNQAVSRSSPARERWPSRPELGTLDRQRYRHRARAFDPHREKKKKFFFF